MILNPFRSFRRAVTERTVSLPSARSFYQKYRYDPLMKIRESHRWLGVLVGGLAGAGLGWMGSDILPEAMPSASDNALFWSTMSGLGFGALGFAVGHYPIQFLNRKLILSELLYLSSEGYGRDRDDANMNLQYLRDLGEI